MSQIGLYSSARINDAKVYKGTRKPKARFVERPNYNMYITPGQWRKFGHHNYGRGSRFQKKRYAKKERTLAWEKKHRKHMPWSKAFKLPDKPLAHWGKRFQKQYERELGKISSDQWEYTFETDPEHRKLLRRSLRKPKWLLRQKIDKEEVRLQNIKDKRAAIDARKKAIAAKKANKKK